MKPTARGAAALRITSLLLCVLCLAVAHPRSARAQAAAGTGHIKQKLDLDFALPEADWVFHTTGTDYFWDFQDMRMALYATSAGCDMDAFVILDSERVGFLGTYMASLEDFFVGRGAETAEEYELWRGQTVPRVVGKLIITGTGSTAGAMHSRMASAAGTPWRNVIYMVLNNMNLMRLTFSAPARSWADPQCAARVDRVINSFLLHGEPDPREERVINGMGNLITADRTKETPTRITPPASSGDTTAPPANSGQTATAPAKTPTSQAAGPDKSADIIDKLDALAAQVQTLQRNQEQLLKLVQDLREQLDAAVNNRAAPVSE